jgi:predicted nucleic acid-binding Zn ribbon protein
MEQIKSIVVDVLRGIQIKQKENPETIWLKCVKKNIAHHTKARYFKNGKLYVNVENPGWLHELNIKKEGILKRLQTISRKKIKYLQFRVGDTYGEK